jgi:hypothetical protein
MSSDQQAIVVELVTKYQAVRLEASAVGVHNGGVPGVSGASVDFDKLKAEYKRLMRAHVPFYTDWATAESRAQEVAAMQCAVRM